MSQSPQPSVQFFSVTLFGSVMGMAGLAIALLTVPEVLSSFVPLVPLFQGFAYLVLLWGALILGLYLAKFVKYPKAVGGEYHHPVASNFFAAISISLLLLATLLSKLGSVWSDFVPLFWWLGAVGQLMMTLLIVNRWIHHEDVSINHATPAWFIPVVGNVVVPITGVAVAPVEVSWYFFGVGIVFWVVIKTILFNRIFFHEPLGVVLRPTLFIFIAPPAVAFLSYLALTGEHLDAFAQILYGVAVFMVFLLTIEVRRFIGLPFTVSFWAYTFPLAAATLASFKMFSLTHWWGHGVIALLILSVLVVIVFILIWKTFKGMVSGQLFLPPK